MRLCKMIKILPYPAKVWHFFSRTADLCCLTFPVRRHMAFLIDNRMHNFSIFTEWYRMAYVILPAVPVAPCKPA